MGSAEVTVGLVPLLLERVDLAARLRSELLRIAVVVLLLPQPFFSGGCQAHLELKVFLAGVEVLLGGLRPGAPVLGVGLEPGRFALSLALGLLVLGERLLQGGKLVLDRVLGREGDGELALADPPAGV